MPKSAKVLPIIITCLLLGASGFSGVSGAEVSAQDEAQVSGDWRIVCDTAESARRCSMVQHLTLKESGDTVLQMVIGHIANQDRPVALITAPLGVNLPAGLDVVVDKGKAQHYAYEFCDSSGCRVAFPLDKATLRAYRRGRYAHVTIANRQRNKITVPVSLKGFSKGIERLRADAPSTP